MIRVKKTIVFIAIICILSGCAGKKSFPIPMNECVIYNEQEVKIADLLDGKNLFFATADINGDSNAEVGFVSDGILYIIDKQNMRVIYEGVSYEHMLNNGSKCGLIYQRDGGAPKHVEYQFIIFDENNLPHVECTWACYDDNEDDTFDGYDTYYFNDEPLEYEKWIKTTGEYMELAKDAETWTNISVNPN
ncbi:MAG: hypothetical protein K5679_09505 [Lachnospiraceae bacterium]|nr:hypothetical protein [Lachnospiraceae bacterium]